MTAEAEQRSVTAGRAESEGAGVGKGEYGINVQFVFRRLYSGKRIKAQ